MSMIEKQNHNMMIMNFSGIYEQENFYKEQEHIWMEFRTLSGCNCYCDDDAKETILGKIGDFTSEGIHFIDSGNYHYISRIWLEKIQQPFRLLVFDNHTDMQPPAFGGILSCGGWIAASLEELTNLQQVFLVGPDEEAYRQVEDDFQKKTAFLSREVLACEENAEQVKVYFENIPTDLPLYISIDKDVLCASDASTTWSQGDLGLEKMGNYLRQVFDRFRAGNQKIIGIDICGECDLDQMQDNQKNDKANKWLLELIEQEMAKYEE